jgi:methionyl-tRNA formyltransferase
MRLLFLGTPDFAVPTLRALHSAGHRIELVLTRPDRPRGRHSAPEPPEVKAAALELGLPVYQPESANAPQTLARLREARAQLGIVVAYGELLGAELVATTDQGFLNLHASLLPDYRGAAPISWAIIRGETQTGVSIIRMVPRLDAGPVLAERRTEIGPTMTAGELSDRLAVLGAGA